MSKRSPQRRGDKGRTRPVGTPRKIRKAALKRLRFCEAEALSNLHFDLAAFSSPLRSDLR